MNYLAIMLIAAIPVAAQVGRSLTIVGVSVPSLYETETAGLADGEYAITNDYSGLALGSQRLRRSSYLAQKQESVTWDLSKSTDGSYRIGGQSGAVQCDGESLIALGDNDCALTIRKIAGANVFTIQSPTGRFLSAHRWGKLAGTWVVWEDEATGGTNQEWLIGSDTLVPSMSARLRLAGGQLNALPHRRIKSNPHVSWERSGSSFIYRVHVKDPSVSWIYINREAGIWDATDVKTPAGFERGGNGWHQSELSAQPVSDEFAVKSSWAPGPVLLEVVGSEDQMAYTGMETAEQRASLVDAHLSRGSYFRVIGPAIPPGTNAAQFRELVRKWITDGLAFLWPLLDDSRSLKDSVTALQPENEYEREAAAVLASQIGGIE